MEESKAACSADQRGHGVLGGVREGDDGSGRAIEVDIDFIRRGPRQKNVEIRIGGQRSAEIFTVGAKKADLIFEQVKSVVGSPVFEVLDSRAKCDRMRE